MTIHRLAQEVIDTMHVDEPNYSKVVAISAISEDLLDHFIDDGK